MRLGFRLNLPPSPSPMPCSYVAMLAKQSPQTGFGAPLDASRHGELNDEQKAMLANLRKETAEAFNRNG